MSETFYKPLTPKFRQDINYSIDENIAELYCKKEGPGTTARHEKGGM